MYVHARFDVSMDACSKFKLGGSIDKTYTVYACLAMAITTVHILLSSL